jgi:hypothetical protein
MRVVGADVGLAEPQIDWFFGPIAFRGSLLSAFWLAYDGKSWDAQFVPAIRAWKQGHRILSYPVSYVHPRKQSEREQGSLAFVEKRMLQLTEVSAVLTRELRRQ